MNRYQMGVIDVTIEELKGEVIADVKDYVTDKNEQIKLIES